MGQLLLPKRFAPGFGLPRVKPTGAIEISDDPLSQGLRLCLLYGEYGTRNIVTGETLGSTAVDFGYGTHGGFFKGQAYAGDNFVNAPAFDTTNWSGVSIVTLCRFDTSNSFPALAYSGDVGNYYGNWLLNRQSAEIYVRLGDSATALVTTSGFAADDLVFIAATYDLADMRVWTSANNGGLNFVSAAHTPAFAGAVAENVIGYVSTGGGRSWTKPIYYTFIFDRALSQAEVNALRVDPYRVIKPRTPVVYYTAAAAGSSSDGQTLAWWLKRGFTRLRF